MEKMSTVRVDSVEEAVQVAGRLRESGRTYWFRGESKVRPLRSSLARKNPEEREIAVEKLARYEGWIQETAGLENLSSNLHAAMAVAQHYELLTNFIDFTTEPRIAGYFASEKGGPERANDSACIICLDVEDLKKFWKPLPKRTPPPEFLEIDVPNLWRLEVQHGCFMFCRYENIEKIYDFDRIIFPNDHALQGIKHADIYPVRKSNLEILLEQFFMNERLIYGDRGMRVLMETVCDTPVVVEVPVDTVEPDVFPDGLPKHTSWNDTLLRPWLELPAEKYSESSSRTNIRVIIPEKTDMQDVVIAVREQLQRDLFQTPGIRQKLINWEVQLARNRELSEDFASRLAPRLAYLWDGLRRLPYRDEDICYGLGMCAAFAVSIKGKFPNIVSSSWESPADQCLIDPVEIEFGAYDGSYSRGYVSAQSLISALRPDLSTYLSDKWKNQMKGNIIGILQCSSDPGRTFDFSLLAPIFAREIVPNQVLARNTAIFYSPARLCSLGLP